MSAESWPPALKYVLRQSPAVQPSHVRRKNREWVAKCLGQMTDANRTEAQAELRQVISDAFQRKALWTTDWAGMQLTRSEPK